MQAAQAKHLHARGLLVHWLHGLASTARRTCAGHKGTGRWPLPAATGSTPLTHAVWRPAGVRKHAIEVFCIAGTLFEQVPTWQGAGLAPFEGAGDQGCDQEPAEPHVGKHDDVELAVSEATSLVENGT